MKFNIDIFLKTCITLSALTLFFGTIVLPATIFYPLYEKSKKCKSENIYINLKQDESAINSYKVDDSTIALVTNKNLILIDICNNKIKKQIIFTNCESDT